MAGVSKDERNLAVVCPYFHRFAGEGRRRIVCAGIFANSETHVIFDTKDDLDAQLDICCNTFNYEDCPLYEAITNMGLTE